MANVLEGYERFDAFNEVYELVRTVEVVGYDRNKYRIEILRSHSNPNCLFSAKYYAQGFAGSALKYPTGEEAIDTMKDAWVHLSQMPSVCGDTAESALTQALSFLSERARL